MRVDEAEAALYALLAQSWTATPLAWHNVDERNFTEPGMPLLPDGDTDYVSVRLDVFSATTLTVPANCIRYSGQLALGICVKERTGTRQAKRYLSDLAACWKTRPWPPTGAICAYQPSPTPPTTLPRTAGTCWRRPLPCTLSAILSLTG